MSSISIETSRDNYEILKVNKEGKEIYIGSKYNQKREIDKFINSFGNFTENDIYIVIGASMLEHIEVLVDKNINFNQILVIEVNEEIKNITKKKNMNKKIHIESELEAIKKFVNKYIHDININYVKIGYYANYDKVYSIELKPLITYLKDISYTILCNRNTSLHFGETWFETLIANLKSMGNSTPINNLQNKFKDIPAIIVSAGPSLSKNIKELKGERKGLVLTGGRTLNTLLNNDILIDYLGVIDPGTYSYELVKDVIDKIDIPLVYYNGTNSEVVDKHRGKKVFSTDNDFINEMFGKEIGNIAGGGSVAHFLTQFAIYIGCNPIVFVGQDLAYTNEKLHDTNAITNEFDENVAYKQKTDLFVEDINSKKVRTSVILNDFRLRLEEIIRTTTDRRFINATQGGANIKGTEVMDLVDVLESFDSIELPVYEESINQSGLFKTKVEGYIELLEKINKKTEVGIVLIDELRKNLDVKNSKKINECIEKIDSIDKYIQENIKSLSLLQNKIFADLYGINNLQEFVVLGSDSEKVRRTKKLTKNKAIYEVMNRHSREAKEGLLSLLEEI